jgi:CheY-like chemotaxis protein
VKVEGAAVDILLVEDDPGDVWFTRDTFDYYKVGNTLHVVGDGAAALRFLRREAPYEDAKRPGVILLDLDLPRMSGRELLDVLAADEDLCGIPVVVVSSSQSEADVLRASRLGASAYITKPIDLDQLVAFVLELDDFYLGMIRVRTPS